MLLHSLTDGDVDLYNVLNSSAILTYNSVFVPNGVAAAEFRSDGAVRPHQCAVRLLTMLRGAAFGGDRDLEDRFPIRTWCPALAGP